jgi:pentose-5-phosphate-3-epimerase
MSYLSEIPKILSQFSKGQKIIALLMLLLTISIITIGPSFVSTITTDRSELEKRIDDKDKKITKMEVDINSMDSVIRTNQRSCTNSIVERENEFVLMLEELKKDAKISDKINLQEKTKIVMVNESYNPNDTVLMMTVRPEPVPVVKTISKKSNMVSKIESMQKKIKTHE